MEAAYGVAEDAGGVEASMADPAGTLAALAERVWRGAGAGDLVVCDVRGRVRPGR